jgi:hypothetical protein
MLPRFVGLIFVDRVEGDLQIESRCKNEGADKNMLVADAKLFVLVASSKNNTQLHPIEIKFRQNKNNEIIW